MAFYAASSPPPPKAPSLAPTTNSADVPPQEEKKKKKGFAKRMLKELAGGGGNNQGVKIKGAPVVRPYGRGGVGVKPAVTSKSSLGSSSPPPSIHQSIIQPQSPPPPSHQQSSTPSDNARYEYYQADFDDNQSTLSTIPAPKRTQQWIQQHAQLPSPPNSSGGEPSVVYRLDTNHRDLYPQSPSPSSYEPSQYSRGSDPHNPYTRDYQQYPGGYVPSNRQHRLPNVDEDRVAGELEDQFGRLDVNGRDRGAIPQSTASMSSRGRPGPASSYNGRSPAGTFTSRYMGSEDYYDDRSRQGMPTMVRADQVDSRNRNPPPQGPDSPTAHILQQYLAQQGLPAPQSYFDQYGAQTRSPQSSQTRELQSQIESLRDAERKARERLEALRKDDSRSLGSGASSAGTRKDDPSGMSRLGLNQQNESRPGSGPRRDDPQGRMTTTQERALIEKEKLRQRDMEREREFRGREMAGSPSPYMQQPQQPAHPPMDALAALMAAQQQQQMMQQPNPLLQALAAQAAAQQLQNGATSPPPASAPLPQAGFGDINQQQLIMQLGALLLQQQQQLQMLAASRATSASPTAAPTPAQGPSPGLPPDPMNLAALLGLGGLSSPTGGLNLAALLQQQQQAQQQPVYPQQPPILTTTAPSLTAHTSSTSINSSQEPPSPTTASSISAVNGPGARYSPEPSPRPSPSPKHREAMGSAHGQQQVPLRIDGLRGVGPSFMSSFNRELGLAPSPTDEQPVPNLNRSVLPPRSSPPRVPLPDLPGGPGPHPHGFPGPNTPPPAYISASPR